MVHWKSACSLKGAIPLAILAVPFVMFDYFILTGVELNKWTLALTFSLWSLPSVQVPAEAFVATQIQVFIPGLCLFGVLCAASSSGCANLFTVGIIILHMSLSRDTSCASTALSCSEHHDFKFNIVGYDLPCLTQ